MVKVILTIVLYFSCSLNIYCSDYNKPSILWREKISYDGEIGGIIPLVLYKNGVLCLGRTKEHGATLFMKSQDNGKTLWTYYLAL